jgi:hypothetical protein
MECVPLVARGRGQREELEALEKLVRYYRANAKRMKYRLHRDEGLPIGSGAVESAPARAPDGDEARRQHRALSPHPHAPAA